MHSCPPRSLALPAVYFGHHKGNRGVQDRLKSEWEKSLHLLTPTLLSKGLRHTPGL